MKTLSRLLKARYYNSYQFYGIITAIALFILMYYTSSTGSTDVGNILFGAFAMKILTIRRFY